MTCDGRGSCTYVSLWRRQAELDQADLSLLYTGQAAVHHLLGQHQTVNQLTLIYGSTAKHKHHVCSTGETQNQNKQQEITTTPLVINKPSTITQSCRKQWL